MITTMITTIKYFGLQQQQVAEAGPPIISWVVFPENKSMSETPFSPHTTAAILCVNGPDSGSLTSTTGCLYRMWDTISNCSVSQT